MMTSDDDDEGSKSENNEIGDSSCTYKRLRMQTLPSQGSCIHVYQSKLKEKESNEQKKLSERGTKLAKH